MNNNCTLSLWSCLCYSIIVVRILWYLHNGEGIFFPWQWALSGHPPSKTHLTSTFKKPSIVIYIGVITPSQARCCPCRHGLDIVVYICKSCYTYWSIQYLSVIKKKVFNIESTRDFALLWVRLLILHQLFMTYYHFCYKRNALGAICGAGTASPRLMVRFVLLNL